MVEQIAYRRGLGDLLAEGSLRAAQAIGPAALPYAMHVKGLELVPFEPRSQTNLALGYAAAPIGPRYDICEHDWDFDTCVGWEHTLDFSRTLGILERIPMDYLGPDKVRNFVELFNLWSAADALDFCIFAVAPTRLLSLETMAAMLAAVTGWETSSYEVMRIGARRNHIMRWYNHREGITAAGDWLPERFYTEAITEGPRQGDVLDRAAFAVALNTLYAMMGWDENGVPTPATLMAAGLEWVSAPRTPSLQ
jgi:aldehyde:ferredoxin oxidoreductase